MEGNHPKRRKDKYNPYTIYEKDGRFYVSFKDGQAYGVVRVMGIYIKSESTPKYRGHRRNRN